MLDLPSTSTPIYEYTIKALEKEVEERGVMPYLKPFHEAFLATLDQLVEKMDSILYTIEKSDDEKACAYAQNIYLTYIGPYSDLLLEVIRMTSNLKLENDVCVICREDESVEPMYCIHCMKVIGCKSCIVEYVGHNTGFVKCLRCQRRSVSYNPMFFLANI